MAALQTMDAFAQARDRVDALAPGSVARAGTSWLSHDGALAPLRNPATLGRRDNWRAQLFGHTHRDWRRFTPSETTAEATMNRAPDRANWLVGGQGAVGGYIFGLSLFRLVEHDTLVAAHDGNARLGSVHRFTGTKFERAQVGMAIGVAKQVSDSWVVGVGAALHRRRTTEQSSVWVGTDSDGSPYSRSDFERVVSLRGTVPLSSAFRVGVVYASMGIPLEVGGGFALHQGGAFHGDGSVRDLQNTTLAIGTARLRDPWRAVGHLAARYLGERYLIEAVATLDWTSESSVAWSLSDVTVESANGDAVALEAVPSVLAHRAEVTVGASVDYEVRRGFVWLVGGYSYRTGTAARNELRASAGTPGHHRIGAGVNIRADGATVTLGYQLGLRPSIADVRTRGAVIAPFLTSDVAFAEGSYRLVEQTIGVGVDLDF